MSVAFEGRPNEDSSDARGFPIRYGTSILPGTVVPVNLSGIPIQRQPIGNKDRVTIPAKNDE